MKPRPQICLGCPGNPKTPGHLPTLWGGHVPPSGPLDAQLLIIGIAPAEEEERQGIPLVGPSGKKVHLAIDWALEGRSLKIRKLNIVNCRTRKPGVSRTWINRDPTAVEFRACAERFLIPELRKTRAKAILILGQVPFDLFLKKLGVQLHNLPKIHKFSFALCMGHRNYIPREMI